MARYPVNLIGMSRLAPFALMWPYGIKDCRVAAASTCDVFLKARGTRLGRHAANDFYLRMRSPVSVYQTEPIVYIYDRVASAPGSASATQVCFGQEVRLNPDLLGVLAASITYGLCGLSIQPTPI
jgi:hypothetical protein